MRAGRGGSSAYLDDWRRETRTCAGDIAAAVREEAERLEAGFPEPYLEAVVKAGGHAVTREDSE